LPPESAPTPAPNLNATGGRECENPDPAIRAKYQQGASRAVLNTWFKNAPENPLRTCLSNVAIVADMDTDEVIRIVLAMDRCLVDAFQRIADSAVSEDVKALFQDLITLEQEEEHKLMRDALELEDV
jgi:hypothetical protein